MRQEVIAPSLDPQQRVLAATTGLQIAFRADQSVLALMSLWPRPRPIAEIKVGRDDFKIAPGKTALDRIVSSADLHLEVGAESRLRLTARTPLELRSAATEVFDYHLDRRLKAASRFAWAAVRAHDEGGFVVFAKVQMKHDSLVLQAGDSLELQAFSPRPINPSHLGLRIAHEGRPRASLPSDLLLESIAQHAEILALHAYFWQEEKPSRRPNFSRYCLRPNPWRNARHEPTKPEELRRVITTARRLGMKVLPYLSPRYSAAADLLPEIQRLQEVWDFDGFYLDGLRGDVDQQVQFMRELRALLGEDGLIYLNASSGPYSDPALPTPAIDAWADFVLRGDSGRGGLSRKTFLREALSGWNRSNAQGLWCHYGSSGWPFPYDRVPGRADLQAALDQHVRLWRRSFWWPGSRDLPAFDAHYAQALADVVSRERSALASAFVRR